MKDLWNLILYLSVLSTCYWRRTIWGWHSLSYNFIILCILFLVWTHFYINWHVEIGITCYFSTFWLFYMKLILSSCICISHIWIVLSMGEGLIDLTFFPGLFWCLQLLILQDIEITSGTLVGVKEWKCLQSLAPIKEPFFSEEFLILNRQALQHFKTLWHICHHSIYITASFVLFV